MGYVIDSISEHAKLYNEDVRFKPRKNVYSSEDEARKAIVDILQKAKVDVLVNYLPVGSEKNTLFYADCALEAKVAFVNAIPVFVSKLYGDKFKEAGLPVIGDDIKSQVGATIVHRVLTKLFEDRGEPVKRTYQINVGGNTDFLNMLNKERLESKRISKTQAVTSQMSDHQIPGDDVYIGPSDYI
ncbi:unnamed protein product, partial [marine sediment metagenome]